MKARLLILSLILLVLGQSFTYGQSKKEKSKTEKELIASIDSMQIVIDSLEIQLMDRDSVATKNMITIDSLKNAIADLSIRSNQRIAFLGIRCQQKLRQEIMRYCESNQILDS